MEDLGFIFKAGKITMNPLKPQAIGDWKESKEFKSFLEIVNYYRRFIRRVSSIAKPLTALKNEVSFIWNDDADSAFRNLKPSVSNANRETNLYNDSCMQLCNWCRNGARI